MLRMAGVRKVDGVVFTLGFPEFFVFGKENLLLRRIECARNVFRFFRG